jgi:hypothetical protein
MVCRNRPALRQLLFAVCSILIIGVVALVFQGCAGSTASQDPPPPPPVPAIAGLSVTSGPVGTPVTISGTDFGATQGNSTVKFNGTPGNPTSWSATSIVVDVPSGATTGSVVVTVDGRASNGITFTVTAPAPTITSLSVTSGAVGTPVTITGTNFGAAQGTSAVKFNGTAATPTSWSATSIAVDVPSGATTGNVVVTVGGQASNGITFTVTAPAPTITGLSVTSGAVGTLVTITGTNFGATQSTSTVKFNGTAGTPTSWSATSIVVPVPSGATTGSVVVTVDGHASNGITFTVTAPAPTIASLSVTSGPTGTPVTITGTNFGATQSTSTVKFNGTAGTPTSWSATSIVVPVPSGATTGSVVVTVGGQASNGFTFTVTTVAAPTITSLSVTSGPTGTPVTITGTNFGATQSTSTVKFNGTAGTPTSWSATSIVVPVPSGATTGSVVVTVGGQASNGITFTVTTVAAPTITSLSVTSGPVGTPVTITGTNFGATQSNSTVKFNGTAGTPTSWTATSIVVPVPSGATTGSVVVTVGGQAGNGITFTVTVPAPTMTSLSVTSGAVGTPVTITGTNFGATQSTSTVKFNGTAGTPTSWSATSIVVPVPSGATTGSVVVTVGGQSSNGIAFTITTTGSISVTVTPNLGGVTITQQIQLAAAVSNDIGAAGVTWSVSSGGTLANPTTTSVSFSAPTAGVYTVRATSIADLTEFATATIGVTDLGGVYSYHNDLARDGVNAQEYALTTANVNTATFGKLFSCTVDGAVYAQPLWAANVNINGTNHNVVFVATEHDSLFAFDADASPCVPLWQVSLIDTNHGATPGEATVPSGTSGNLVGSGSGDITPEVGVSGTPVIDPSTNTLYVVSKSMNSGGTSFYQRLHAIDITTGNEKFGGPANITSAITFPGDGDGGSTDSFNAQQQNQRSGLALVNGVVYVVWASHEDRAPYYGWVVGFNASNLTVTSVLNVTPNVWFGGIWMAGGAPAADASGNLYVITGNGQFDVTSSGDDYGDSFLQLSNSLAITSFFTPSDQQNDYDNDRDFGSGGAAVVLNLTSGSPQHLVIGGGKDGTLYLLNGDNMGGLGDSNALQNFPLGHGIFATGAFWNGSYYIAGISGPLVSFAFNTTNNLFNPSIALQSATTYGFPGSTPSVSATGSSNGIVWAIDSSAYCTYPYKSCGPAILHAYDATTLGTDLWNSSMVGTDAAGNAVKFTVPTVANGKVYVGTRGNNTGGTYGSTTVSGELDVYGLK